VKLWSEGQAMTGGVSSGQQENNKQTNITAVKVVFVVLKIVPMQEVSSSRKV
jgi:hypothetical protein